MLASDSREYLGCKINEVGIGIPSEDVSEVFEAHSITRVPNLPEYVLGVINVRGQIVPVLDMWNIVYSLSGVKTIVILNSDQGLVGLLVSKLIDLLKLDSFEKPDRYPGELKNYAEVFPVKSVTDREEIYLAEIDQLLKMNLPAPTVEEN